MSTHQSSRSMAMEDDDEVEEFPNLPPFGSRQMQGDGRPPFWFYMEQKTLSPGCRLCNKMFDWNAGGEFPRFRPNHHSSRKERLACEHAHKWKTLRAPPSYSCNNKLPEHAPEYLKSFLASDWGTGHGEAPRFEIPFEDTYPTKATRAIEMLVYEPDKFQGTMQPLIKAGKVLKESLPHDGWTAVGTQLCYHFSLKDGKCPHWHNCMFLHVHPSKLRQKFKQYRCMCGPNDGLCKYGKYNTCMYAHAQSQLTVPAELEESGYPSARGETHKLSWTSPTTGVEVTARVPTKFIANTCRKSHDRLCAQTHDWCNKKECTHGVHLIPEGWAWLKQQCKEGPVPPAYFSEKVRRLMRQDPKAKAKQARPGAPEVTKTFLEAAAMGSASTAATQTKKKTWGEVAGTSLAGPSTCEFPTLAASSKARPEAAPSASAAKQANKMPAPSAGGPIASYGQSSVSSAADQLALTSPPKEPADAESDLGSLVALTQAQAAQEKDAVDPMGPDVGLSGACTAASWSDTRSVGNMSESERAASACPESPDDWGVPEVAEWLGAEESGKFLRYVDVFRQNEIDGRTLRSLTKEDLKEDLQVKELGIRKALLLAIERLFA
mmetsp:Transcript_54838/g.127990  ORF Transcript_54838/g.127990 Transcript_54838/m.127990 type:complete len:605 (+) Transcript_54838:70-1884(+)